MQLNLYQIDAFTDKIFGGNPACVVPMTEWLPDETLLKIAQENAVAETAFFIQCDEKVKLRWFTPEIEMDLCGHATLATAYVLKKILNYPNEIVFDTLSGDLIVKTDGDLLTLDFPSRKPLVAELPPLLLESLNIKPQQVLKARDYVLVYDSQSDIEKIAVNRQIFDQTNLHPGGVIFTAKGDNCDFVSRFFTPQSSILEDPVTGSAHCSLIPYWSERLGKNKMNAMQISARQGKLICEDRGDRVLISGTARTYLTGSIVID
ncbi:PhzF family phenazine biosynthesis protein [Candidatus Uabimicrobium amorphum]|uniref:Isomerase n=1 Tax=Uabimicrobium amorphum TaxID=2596890 RepID=A0A5S9ITH9_UABAM|nr:PhzF family phenazine biosynthesis protein [Candidatus Uabimicrobium amorphum]BBM87467.1 isomerase [Candidatus Uabimicrobium amorphum]